MTAVTQQIVQALSRFPVAPLIPALILAILLTACAPSNHREGSSFGAAGAGSTHLTVMLEEARRDPAKRPTAEASCMDSMK